MAEYSKQWCDIWDTEMPYDFDINKITKVSNELLKKIIYTHILKNYKIIKFVINKLVEF